MTARRKGGPKVAVLDAAAELFDEVGYAGTTIELIQMRSEVSVGSIYHYFGSKQGIAGLLYLQSFTDYSRMLLASLSDDAEDSVRAVVAHHFKWVKADPARARLLMQRHENEHGLPVRQTIDDTWSHFLDRLQLWQVRRAKEGATKTVEPSMLYAIWLGPAQEYTRIAFSTVLEAKSARFPPDTVTTFADAAWAALGR